MGNEAHGAALISKQNRRVSNVSRLTKITSGILRLYQVGGGSRGKPYRRQISDKT